MISNQLHIALQSSSSVNDVIHVALKVPRHAAKALHRWALDQKWPEGTELESFNEYHCTLLYAPNGHEQWHEADWIPALEQVEIEIDGFDNFGPEEDGRWAYVLLIKGQELEDHANKLQGVAAMFGLVDTHFGAYRPHITIGYGPQQIDPASLEVPHMTMHLGPSAVSEPKTSAVHEFEWGFVPADHYHPYTGLPCNCYWGSRNARNQKRYHKLRHYAGQYLNQALKTQAKWLNSPEGHPAKEYLTHNLPEQYESLAPYIAQQAKLRHIAFAKNDYGYWPLVNGRSLENYLPLWHQWYEARQHPLRRGINIMDPKFVPHIFQQKVEEFHRALQDQQRRDKWIEEYAPSANVVHRFGPEAGKYKGWHVVKLDPYQAEGDSEALGHCIGSDEQPYKHHIDQDMIDAYSLRDKNGYPHVSWHFNPGGATIGHMQGRSGDPKPEYRNLMSLFHHAHSLPDEEGYEEPLEEPYLEEYELPEIKDVDDLVSQYNYPEHNTDGVDGIGPETIITPGPIDWESVAYNYLTGRYGSRILEEFFQILHDHSLLDFHKALEKEYEDLRGDPTARNRIREFNDQVSDHEQIDLGPEPADNLEDYVDQARNLESGQEMVEPNWPELAQDYLNRWADERPQGYGETRQPSIYDDFIQHFSPGNSNYTWGHTPAMTRSLEKLFDPANAYHQEAIQFWNTHYPGRNVVPQINAEPVYPYNIPGFQGLEYRQRPIRLFDPHPGGTTTWKDWNVENDANWPPVRLTSSVKVSTISDVAETLHQRYMHGTSPTDIVDYAKRILRLVGYPHDDLSTQAALQAWQMLYPEDQMLQDQSSTPQAWRQAIATANPQFVYHEDLDPYTNWRTGQRYAPENGPNGFWGRWPVVYDAPNDTLHVGPEGTAHVNIINKVWPGKQPGEFDHQGWVGHNQEQRGNYEQKFGPYNIGWYTKDYAGQSISPPDARVNMELAYHTYPRHPDSDISDYGIANGGYGHANRFSGWDFEDAPITSAWVIVEEEGDPSGWDKKDHNTDPTPADNWQTDFVSGDERRHNDVPYGNDTMWLK